MINKRLTNIQKTMDYWLRNTFANAGGYNTVTSGLTGWFQNIKYDRFTLSHDPSYPEGTVWESYYDNFVFDQDVSAPSGYTDLIICSGVYVDNVFIPNGSGVHVDYLNGRVIFDTPQSVTASVVGEFSYNTVAVYNVANDRRLFSDVFNRPETIPSGTLSKMPIVFYELYRAGTIGGYQLGGGKNVEYWFNVYVIADNLVDRDNVLETLKEKEEIRLKIIDFDSAPEIFDEYGSIANDFHFSNWQDNYSCGQCWVRRIVYNSVDLDYYEGGLAQITLRFYNV